MTTTYREVRLGDVEDALAFAKEHGSTAEPGQLRHTYSLGVKTDDQPAGYALTLEPQPGQFVVELVLTDTAVERGLGQPMADAVLRKLSAAGIDTARLRFLNDGETDRLWQATNWLDRVPCGDQPPEPVDDADTDAPSESPDDSAQAA